jgi:hypothetical protein
LIWMIVCFSPKRTFDCTRSVSAIGPFTRHCGHSRGSNYGSKSVSVVPYIVRNQYILQKKNGPRRGRTQF